MSIFIRSGHNTVFEFREDGKFIASTNGIYFCIELKIGSWIRNDDILTVTTSHVYENNTLRGNTEMIPPEISSLSYFPIENGKKMENDPIQEVRLSNYHPSITTKFTGIPLNDGCFYICYGPKNSKSNFIHRLSKDGRYKSFWFGSDSFESVGSWNFHEHKMFFDGREVKMFDFEEKAFFKWIAQ